MDIIAVLFSIQSCTTPEVRNNYIITQPFYPDPMDRSLCTLILRIPVQSLLPNSNLTQRRRVGECQCVSVSECVSVSVRTSASKLPVGFSAAD